MDNIGYYNGVFAPIDELMVPACDRGMYFGDGAYEAIRVEKHVPFAIDEHFDRLYDSLRALRIPSDLTPIGSDTVAHGQIDRNGHRNHVDYIRSAEAVLPGRRRLELCYEHECFEGETLTLLRSGDIVQGVKPDGTESFRARLWEELS